MNEEVFIDWKTQTDDKGIVWLSLDKQGTDTNVLSVSVLDQLDFLIEEIIDDNPTAVIFQSAKASGFIAGADVKEFLEVNNTQEALIMIKRGQKIFSRIASSMSRPT